MKHGGYPDFSQSVDATYLGVRKSDDQVLVLCQSHGGTTAVNQTQRRRVKIFGIGKTGKFVAQNRGKKHGVDLKQTRHRLMSNDSSGSTLYFSMALKVDSGSKERAKTRHAPFMKPKISMKLAVIQ
jgi:hypothetical protein